MTIHGFQKMTLLDFPGKVACIVFTAGCNLRCPFCHNARLVTHAEADDRVDEDEIFAYLQKRRGIVDGVVITGGEPTLQKDLADFIRRVRALGYAVKLDTNGTRPEVLSALLDAGLVDYVAMDIKNCPDRYAETVGIEGFDLGPVQTSLELLRQSGVDYELRTTVADELHTPQDLGVLAAWIAPSPRYFIQPFVDSGDLIGTGLHAPSAQKLEQMLASARMYLPNAAIRGA
jgi:pyruvate formate lyase activating enzyme